MSQVRITPEIEEALARAMFRAMGRKPRVYAPPSPRQNNQNRCARHTVEVLSLLTDDWQPGDEIAAKVEGVTSIQVRKALMTIREKGAAESCKVEGSRWVSWRRGPRWRHLCAEWREGGGDD